MGYIKTRYLYKIATAAENAEWVAAGSITGSGLDLSDGFFHSSDGVMVKTVASMFFKGANVPHACAHPRAAAPEP